MVRLTLKNLTLAYDGRPVIEDLSLSVDNGDYLCVVGENGSGKSTLIKGILGLVKPQKGSIDFCCNRHRKSIGYYLNNSRLKGIFLHRLKRSLCQALQERVSFLGTIRR